MRNSVRPFLPTTVLMPLFAASLGIDGGAIFLIVAKENLGLSSSAIGIAFGLGTLSVPVQLYAARAPIHRARHNVQIFLCIFTVQLWILAALVAFEATQRLAIAALVVTVAAEVALSVLFATAWQPLLSIHLTPLERQRITSWWRAGASVVLSASLALFGVLNTNGRCIFLVVAGVLAIASARSLSQVSSPPLDKGPTESGDQDGTDETASVQAAPGKTASATSESVDTTAPGTTDTAKAELRRILFVAAFMNVAALPLWILYVADVLWPTANLGLIAAAQTMAAMMAMLSWRPTEGSIGRRLRAANGLGLIAAVVVPLTRDPSDSLVAQIIIFAITILFGFSITTARIAMLELSHRAFSTSDAVRSFTFLDVVASTSVQLGLFAAGFLIRASISTSWTLDPYQCFVIAGSAAGSAAVHKLAKHELSY